VKNSSSRFFDRTQEKEGRRPCLSFPKNIRIKKREKQEKQETDLIVIDSLTTQAQRHAERIEKSMDIVPGTDDSLSSKASKKSTRDWEKTKEHAIRWAFSTGKAAWTFGTTFLVLVVPLIVELHREEQMMEMEKEQMGVLADQQQQQQQQL
jgi:import receptor subunit TOM22|tara:strand:- start:474 stop:926 length:453 start_codon:yes stop_codon:yes gene_type:complete